MKHFPAPRFPISALLNWGLGKKPGAKLSAALALMAGSVLMSPSCLAAQTSFTLYAANYLNYGGINERYCTIEKFDALGNASVFITNSSFTNPILYAPVSVALDSSGNVYVDNTQDNFWIEEFSPSGNNPFVFAYNVGDPNDMVFDTAGNLYVAEYSSAVYRYSPGGVKSVFATFPGTLEGLAFDAAGNLYAAENYHNTIWKIDPGGNPAEFAAPPGSPYALAFDASSNLYVSLNTGIIEIYQAGANGVLSTNGNVFANVGPRANPTGLAFDGAGNLYVAEYYSNQIVKISPQTNITVFSTNGLNGPAFIVIQGTAPTVINSTNHYSYGANFGWADWHGNAANGANNGAVIGEYVCSGYVYAANVGWINLGTGSPTNGIYYQNLSPGDYGVNQDGLGNLRGYAYSANVGWLNFETNGAPVVDLQTGFMSGCVWSANCGWISLSNAFAYVQADAILPGPSSTGDGIPDAWALLNFGTVNINPSADPTGKGMTILDDYLAGTNPNNSNDVLAVTSIGYNTATPGSLTLQWSGNPTRSYAVQFLQTLDNTSSWTDVAESGLGAGSATFNTGDTNVTGFYRIRAFLPLMP